MEKCNHDITLTPETIAKIVRDSKVRSQITRACHFWFFNIYFQHYLKYKASPFHKELFSLTEDDRAKTAVIEAFRSSGKTTIMGMSYAIWSILGCQNKKFVLILAQTQEQARQMLANIKKEFETNPLLRHDLGPFEEVNDEWRMASLVLPKYGARIMVASVDKPVRGLRHGEHRPDLIICDDLEDLNSVRTQESRDKLFNWLMGDVIPLGDLSTRLIVIGTRLHEDSLISRLVKEIKDGRMDGVVKFYPLLNAKGTSIWPDKYPKASDIKALKRSLPNIQAWEREYLLHIVAEDDQIVRPEWIHYYDALPPPEECSFSATGIDLAISESTNADYTAMVSAKVYGRGKNRKIYIMPNPVNERLNFPKTIEKAKAVSESLGNGSPTILYIENVGYQRVLVQQLQGEGFPAEEFSVQGQDKRMRLSLTSQHIQSGMVLFQRGSEKMINQIVYLGTERHDDLADAFSIVVLKILERFRKSSQMGGIPLLVETDIPSPPKKESKYSNVSIPLWESLGVVVAGEHSKLTVIVGRTKNSIAKVLYESKETDPDLVSRVILQIARDCGIARDPNHILIEKSFAGMEVSEKIRKAVGSYKSFWVDTARKPEGYEKEYGDLRTQAGFRMKNWLARGGDFQSAEHIDELFDFQYHERDGVRQIVNNDELAKHGLEIPAAAEALMLTFTAEKAKEIDAMLKTAPFYDQTDDIWNGRSPRQ